MANLTREQRAQREAQKAAQATAPEAGLVPMVKDDETIDVHPDCVKAHLLKGWQVKDEPS